MSTKLDLKGVPSTSEKSNHLSFGEITARLPLLVPIASDALRLYRVIESTKARINQILSRRGKTPVAAIYAEEVEHIQELTEKRQEDLDQFLKEIFSLGADQIDLTSGTVRFPAAEESEFLVWSIDEPDQLTQQSTEN